MSSNKENKKLVKKIIMWVYDLKVIYEFARILGRLTPKAFKKCDTPFFIISYVQLAHSSLLLDLAQLFDPKKNTLSIYSLMRVTDFSDNKLKKGLEDEIAKCVPIIKKIVKKRNKIIAHTDIKTLFELDSFEKLYSVNYDEVGQLLHSLFIMICVFVDKHDVELSPKERKFVKMIEETSKETQVIMERLLNIDISSILKNTKTE